MKTTSIHLFGSQRDRAEAWGLLVLSVATFLAGAFPPAPSHVIYGLARDTYGNPITATDAKIILTTSTGVQLTTDIIPCVEPNVNYRLVVPMDCGMTADAYTDAALQPSASFRMMVVVGGRTNLPIQMQGNFKNLGLPAQETRVDLTLGVDSSGDGLPDAWKQLILAMSGGAFSNIRDIHPNGHFPGNPMTFLQCYIAGTYPWDTNSSFIIDFIGYENGTSMFELQCMRGRSYTVVSSSDFQSWS